MDIELEKEKKKKQRRGRKRMMNWVVKKYELLAEFDSGVFVAGFLARTASAEDTNPVEFWLF